MSRTRGVQVQDRRGNIMMLTVTSASLLSSLGPWQISKAYAYLGAGICNEIVRYCYLNNNKHERYPFAFQVCHRFLAQSDRHVRCSLLS